MKTQDPLKKEPSEEAGRTSAEVELKDILPHLNQQGLEKVDSLVQSGNEKELKKFFSSFKDMFDVDNINAEKISAKTIEIVAEFGSLLNYQKNLNQTKTQEQPLNPKEMKTTDEQKKQELLEKGKLVSVPFQNTFLKGKIKEINDQNMVIEHLKKGDIIIPKEKFNEVISMFPGQKYDAREISGLFPLGGVDYFSLDKKDRMALMKGDETSALKMEFMKKQPDSAASTLEVKNIRLKIEPSESGLKISTIQGFQDKIYNREITPEEKEKMKAGEILKGEATTKEGKEFKMLMYYDKELDAFRAKAPKDKNLEQGKIYNVDLSKDELNRLNSGETINVARQDKNGNNLNYTVSFDKELGKLNVSKGEIGEGLKNNQKDLKEQNKQQAKPEKPIKPKGLKIS